MPINNYRRRPWELFPLSVLKCVDPNDLNLGVDTFLSKNIP